MEKYDVIIIGSGPGGYVAAIRCAQLGFKTTMIEKYSTLGGTCLNVGCMPSKALLDSSEHYYNALRHFNSHGISFDNLNVDFDAMIKRKSEVIKKINTGVVYLMKKNKIQVHHGTASFIDNRTIEVNPTDEEKYQISGTHIIIATGSKASSLPNVPIDKECIISSTEALSLKEIPKNLIIIGAGVIGVELGSVYARLGSKVRVVEYAERILASMDSSVSSELQKSLAKLGFEFFLNHSVKSAENRGKDGVHVNAQDKDGKKVVLRGDYCLVAVGRKPFTEGLALNKAGVEVDDKGRIIVNEGLETSAPGIYAIGDVIKGAMLAHKASEEGIFVAERIAGQKPHINYRNIPGIVYTWPEAAAVGFTEEELRQSNRSYKIGSFPFIASGRAITSGDTEGMIKVLADKETDEILGVHIVGPRASDIIGEATYALETKASAEDIARTSHGHPTYYEALKEACMAVGDGAIHI